MKLRNLLLVTMAGTMFASAALTATPVKAETIVKETNTQYVKKTDVKLENGDSLWQLSVDYDVTMQDIVKANGLDSINEVIQPNQELIIPGLRNVKAAKAVAPVATPAPAVKTVAPVKAVATTPAVAPVKKVAVKRATTSYTTTGNSNSAKEWIAQRESGGSYSARNGQFVGRYQLSGSYLNGDYSAANQERVADNYVHSRYGSWQNAKNHWLSNGWY